jgi:hypothetical protein
VFEICDFSQCFRLFILSMLLSHYLGIVCTVEIYVTSSSNGFLHLLDQMMCFSGEYFTGSLQKCVCLCKGTIK